MRIGTKSVLFGAHCFVLHWAFVAWGWWTLYGFPWDPRLWVAFIIHDFGYWGKPNMDGEEGEQHPRWAANVMYRLFDRGRLKAVPGSGWVKGACDRLWGDMGPMYWHDLVLYHSRFLAKRAGKTHSRLCVADKLAIALEPSWLYLPRVILTGEIREYMALAAQREGAKYAGEMKDLSSRRAWHRSMQEYIRSWVAEHRDGRVDTWTGKGVGDA